MITTEPLVSLFSARPKTEQDLVASDLDAIAAHFQSTQNASLELRRHPRARNLTLRVNAATRKIVATIPKRASRREAAGLILAHYAWITERLLKAPQVMAFIDGTEIPFRGRPHRICFRAQTRGRGVVAQIEGETGSELHVAGRPEYCPRRLKDWLVRTAKTDLEERTKRHASTLGVTYRRISVRDQSSRWGSCSSTGTLSFSWRLILAPPEILDYVAAHEVAHLKEMNHSPAFWSIVSELCPDFKAAEHWLTNEGPDLHRYCPTHLM